MRTEVIDVPREFIALADRRTQAIMLASIHFADALRTIARSCYLQGLEDGYETMSKRGRDAA